MQALDAVQADQRSVFAPVLPGCFQAGGPTEACACQLAPFLFCACWQAVTFCCRKRLAFQSKSCRLC